MGVGAILFWYFYLRPYYTVYSILVNIFEIILLDKIKAIIVNGDKVMTIENKTSFLRMNNGD